MSKMTSRKTVDTDIIRSIIEAATRLVPSDNTVDGSKARRQRERERAERARRAEGNFVQSFRRGRLRFTTENEQKKRAISQDRLLSVTLDIFTGPVVIDGHSCLWIEYKHYFGFRENPYVAASEKRQAQKYARQIGPGVMVYALGFEQEHLYIDSVKVIRETDVVQELVRLNKP